MRRGNERRGQKVMAGSKLEMMVGDDDDDGPWGFVRGGKQKPQDNVPSLPLKRAPI